MLSSDLLELLPCDALQLGRKDLTGVGTEVVGAGMGLGQTVGGTVAGTAATGEVR